MIGELLEVHRKSGDPRSEIDPLGKPLVARIENIDMVVFGQQVHHVDVFGSVRRPAWNEDERLALAGLPVGELDAVIRDKGVDLQPSEVGQLCRQALDPVREGKVPTQHIDRRSGRCLIRRRDQR